MDKNRIVAGLDVHKDTIYLCIMGYDEAIIFEKTYGTLTTDLWQMREDMVERGVNECAMESTAVYWVPVWNELFDHMSLKLVNPYFIKQLPDRKSDVKDAQWIAERVQKNLIRGSFVPDPVVQDMLPRLSCKSGNETWNCSWRNLRTPSSPQCLQQLHIFHSPQRPVLQVRLARYRVLFPPR